jgi:hypothetical protein
MAASCPRGAERSAPLPKCCDECARRVRRTRRCCLEFFLHGGTRAGAHDANPITEQDSLGDVVRDKQNGTTHLGADLHQLVLEDRARLRVERRKWLVHQEDRRVENERAGELRALLHAPG